MNMRQRAADLLKSNRNVITAGWVIYAAVAGWMVLSNSAFWLYAAGLTVIYAISALGLDWIQGRAGQVSIGSAGFMAVGAFVAAVAVEKGVPSIPALILAAVAGGLTGLLVGLPALRLRGLYLALATLALQFITSALGNQYETASGNVAGIPVLNTNIGPISLTAGRSFFGSLLTTAAYEASIASSTSSSGIAPPIRR